MIYTYSLTLPHPHFHHILAVRSSRYDLSYAHSINQSLTHSLIQSLSSHPLLFFLLSSFTHSLSHPRSSSIILTAHSLTLILILTHPHSIASEPGRRGSDSHSCRVRGVESDGHPASAGQIPSEEGMVSCAEYTPSFRSFVRIQAAIATPA
jgi:hypothetical protein